MEITNIHLNTCIKKPNICIFTVSATNGGPAAPPPPPPPPPPEISDDASAGSGADKERNALFADLNKGADVTKGNIPGRAKVRAGYLIFIQQ